MYLICKVVDYLIDPFVGGTSAADPESLSVSDFATLLDVFVLKNYLIYFPHICDQMKHSFPDLWNIEKRYLFHVAILYLVTRRILPSLIFFSAARVMVISSLVYFILRNIKPRYVI